jgi:hypothetical protein
MTSFVVKNNAESLVADNPLAQAAVTLNVTNGEGTNFPSTFPFLITIWDETTYHDPKDDSSAEIVKCTARSTDALTIVRAQEGTGDVAHALGERVAMLITAGIFNDATYGAMRKDASIWLGAEGAYLPATNPAALTEVAGATTYGGWSYLAFDDTTSEHAIWRVPMPDYDGGNIVVTAFSKPATTPSGAVTLQFNILTIGLANSEAFNAASTSDTGVNISQSMNTTELLTDVMIASATIDPANVAADDLMVIELARDVASDNLTGDGQLIGILVEYTKT